MFIINFNRKKDATRRRYSLKSFLQKKMGKEAKSAIVYTISTLFSRGLAIITVPIFTRIMTTEQIGIVNIYNSWYSMISAVATLSLTSGGYIVALKEFSSDRDSYQSSILSLTSLVSLIISLLFVIAPSFWVNLLNLPKHLLILMLFGFLFAPARDFWLARQRYEHRYKLAGLIISGSAVLASALSIIVVLILNNRDPDNVATGRLFANYIVIYGVAATLWIYTFVKGKSLVNLNYWKFSLSLSIPLIGYSVATQILGVSDRAMIGSMVDNSAVGIYGTLYTVSSLSLMVWQAIHSSFVPYLFQNIQATNSKVKKISTTLVFLYSIVAVLLTYFAPEIVRILATEEYYEAIYIMPPIAGGVYLTCLTNLYSDVPVYFKQTKFVMLPAMLAAIVNVVLNYIFIKLYGYMAAAYTTLFSYIIWALVQAFFTKSILIKKGLKNLSIYEDRRLFWISIFTISFCLIGLFLYQSSILRYTAITILFLIGGYILLKYKKKGET